MLVDLETGIAQRKRATASAVVIRDAMGNALVVAIDMHNVTMTATRGEEDFPRLLALAGVNEQNLQTREVVLPTRPLPV